MGVHRQVYTDRELSESWEKDKGGTIRAVREEMRYSQESLGGILGVNVRTMSLWENNKNAPPHYLIYALKYLRGIMAALK